MTPEMISACELKAQALLEGLGVPCFFSGMDVPASVKLFVRFYVVASDEALPIGLGLTAKSRNVGLIQATVYGPRGQGAGPTGDIADAIWKEFRRSDMVVGSEGALTFKDGSVIDMKERNEQHIHVARVPYRYDFAL